MQECPEVSFGLFLICMVYKGIHTAALQTAIPGSLQAAPLPAGRTRAWHLHNFAVTGI
jgi:hypothetical protein